jgi:glutamate-5-semialdehyde dehydrogenase
MKLKNEIKLQNSDLNIEESLSQIFKNAKIAASELAITSTAKKNKALIEAANSIMDNANNILQANQRDVEESIKQNHNNAFIDRLSLDFKRIEAIAKSIREIAELPDPVGKKLSQWQRPNGLNISRVATPIGVIGIIYESRPNVTGDAGALCLKSGNAAILRGGSESFNSSSAIAYALQQGLAVAGITKDAIQFIPFKEREAVSFMLKASDYIDVIVPRGGKGLIKKVIEESRIPLFQHLEGNCHTYIEASAKPEMAHDIVLNAKLRRTGVCGATESIVIDENILESHFRKIANSLIEKGCEIRGDEKICALDSRIKKATAEDWDTEYLDSIVSAKAVKNFDEGLAWVKAHSSHHTDAIITENANLAARFLNEIDSAIVVHNSSTQFADGGEFGMGAEIGIATGKMHARGPVGVEQLCTFKYIVEGNGQVRGG